MRAQENTFSLKELKKGLWLTIKLTLIFSILFFLINRNYTVKSFLINLGISAMYSFSLGLGQGLLNDYLTTKWDWVTQTNRRVWVGIIATICYTVPVILIIHYFLYIKIFGNSFDIFFSEKMIWNHLFWMIFTFAISAFLHARGFMIEWKKSVSQESTKQEILAKTETAKFESLKNQLDPHFLFNSLNVLTSLIFEDQVKAEKFTTKLSKIYRYVLEQRNKDLVPIEEELKFAKAYVELLGMRFEDAVQFSIPNEVSNKELKIVPLSLQLLLENAVKHNVVSSIKPLEIIIFEENGFLHIQNNINPKETIGKSTKVGLQNIVDRYGLISNRQVKIENNNKIFKVSLPLLTKINTMMNTQDFENSNYIKAVEKVEKLKEFYQNLVSFCLVIPFLIFINFRFSPGFHWFWFPIFGWGIGLTFHFLEVNNYNIFMGKDWEERKIKEMMEEEGKKAKRSF